MGKKKTVVAYSISRMLGDGSIFTKVKQGIKDYGLGKSPYSSLATLVKEEAPQRLHKKFQRFDRWASRPNAYYFGDTTSSYQVRDFDSANAHIRNKLETEYATSILIKYSEFNDPDLSHIIWVKLIRDFGYSTETNQLTSVYDQPLYLKNGVVKYCRPTIDQATANNTLARLNPYGLSYMHGATYDRVQDYTLEPTAYEIDESALHDMFYYTSTVRINSTQIIVKNTDTNTVISDTTTYDGTPPMVYEALNINTLSDSTTNDVGTSTRTIVKTNDFDIANSFDLLDFEYSGLIDETDALTEDDATNIDPNAEDTTVVDDKTPSEYFMVSFTYTKNSATVYDYFTYEYGSGTDTTLDNIFSDGDSFGNYVPRIYMRRDGVALNKEELKDTFKYKSSKRACSKLGLDYDYLCDELHNNIGSLGKVKQISLAAIVAVNDLTPLQLEYFFYWIRSHYNVSAPHTDPVYLAISPAMRESRYITFKDNENLSTLGWGALDTGIVDKVIGDVGTFSQEKKNYGIELDPNAPESYTSLRSKNHHIFKQINATQCLRYSIWGLFSAERVQGGYFGIVGSFESACYIPLDLTLLGEFSSKNVELLCGQCLYVLVNTSQVIKKKWYQTGVFQAIMFAISVILALPSGGLSLAAFAEAVAVAIFTNIVVTVVITILVKVFKLDALTATFLYIVASIAAGYGPSFNTISAEALLINLNSALNIYSVANKLEYALVMQEQAKFAVEQSEQQRYLDEAKEQFDFRDYVYSPLYSPSNPTMYAYVRIGETPTEFYRRIPDSLNVPELCYSFVSMFHSSMLQLPKP